MNAVFYYNGLNFVLRGGREHRDLMIAQLNFGYEPDQDCPDQVLEFVEYVEHGSKNRPGGRKQLNLENKKVRQYARPELGSRCHVYLLKLYLSKLPPGLDESSVFYCKPLTKLPFDVSAPWYSAVPVGHNKLEKKLKEICLQADVDVVNKSNHSLRATSISRMYRSSIPEKVIMERSGHLSKEGLRSYERTSVHQIKSACDATVPSKQKENDGKQANLPIERKPEITQHVVNAGNQPPAIAPNDVLKTLNFQAVHGGIFNINLHINQ